MNGEGDKPFGGGKPSEPPRGSTPGTPNYLGPGITPPEQQGQTGAGKRFCSNCGKEWPIETKFCTACGTWMQGEQEAKKTYKDHIAEQLQTRQVSGEVMPTFVQQGPPKKEHKGRSPLVNAIIVLLCLVLIVGGVVYTFFQADACTLIGKFMAWRGKYTAAAEWYNASRKIKNDGGPYKRATASMANLSMKLYSEYFDAMKYKDWTADVEVEGGLQKTWKVYNNANGDTRIEAYGQYAGKEDVVKVVIETDGKRYIYEVGKQAVISDLNENEAKSRKKAEKDKVLSGINSAGSAAGSMLFVGEKIEKIEGKNCYVLTARIAPDKRGEFLSLAGFSGDYPHVNEANSFRLYIGTDDKLLHRFSVMPEGREEPLASFTFTDIKIGTAPPEGSFGVDKEFKRKVN